MIESEIKAIKKNCRNGRHAKYGSNPLARLFYRLHHWFSLTSVPLVPDCQNWFNSIIKLITAIRKHDLSTINSTVIKDSKLSYPTTRKNNFKIGFVQSSKYLDQRLICSLKAWNMPYLLLKFNKLKFTCRSHRNLWNDRFRFLKLSDFKQWKSFVKIGQNFEAKVALNN